MDFFGDYHTHSKYSDGRSTVREIAFAGMAKGLSEVGIADHGPANLGVGIKGPHVLYQAKQEAEALNTEFRGKFRVLIGVEADVVTLEGGIDIGEDVRRDLDLLLLGLHPYVLPRTFHAAAGLVVANRFAWLSQRVERGVEMVNTHALVEAITRHRPDVVTHPGLGMPVDFREVAKACRAAGCAFEINAGHDYVTPRQLELVAAEGAQVIVNSDAHRPEMVGELAAGWRLLAQSAIDPNRVVNLNPMGKKRLRQLQEEGAVRAN